MKFLYASQTITMPMSSAARRQMKNRIFVLVFSFKNISRAQGIREVAAYLKDEKPTPMKIDIEETL